MSELVSELESEIEKIGKVAYNALKDAKDHPTLIGVILLGAGIAIREFGQSIDLPVWDFRGNHVPPQAVKPPPALPTADPNNPQNLPGWEKGLLDYTAKFIGLAEMFAPGANVGVMAGAATTGLDVNKALAQAGSPVPNVFDLIGMKLPDQITVSEVLIIAGLVQIFEPLIKAIAGTVGGLEKMLPGLPKLG